MKLALNEAKLQPNDVDVISAHATSTEIGDRSETLRLKSYLAIKPTTFLLRLISL